MAKTKETVKEPQPQQANYYFICACGCGQTSDNLGKDYIRLRKNQKWYKKGCGGNKTIVQEEFKGGVIVNESDF